MKLTKLFFGDEKPGFSGFFRAALFRLVLFYPFAILVSNSATDVCDVFLLLFWLLGGNWKERIAMIKRSSVLTVAVFLSVLSFIGALQFEPTAEVPYWESLLRQVKYWWGHHPIPILIILATVLTTKTRRIQLLGVLSIALLLALSYSVLRAHVLVPNGWSEFPKLTIAKNTIWFGMAFVILAGLWMCVPYLARKNPCTRKLSTSGMRAGMRTASTMSFFDIFPFFFRRSDISIAAYFLNLLRWGIIAACISYVFLVNPSRTAYLAMLCGIAILLLLRGWKSGIVYIVLISTITISIACLTSSTFQQKTSGAKIEIRELIKVLLSDDNSDFKYVNGGRLDLYYQLLKEIIYTPLGVGMQQTQQRCLAFNHRLDNTHSEFLAFASQIGLPGLVLFSVWLYLVFRCSADLAPPWRQLGLYTATVLLVDAIFNGALSQDMEGHQFCILIAVIATTPFSFRPSVGRINPIHDFNVHANDAATK